MLRCSGLLVGGGLLIFRYRNIGFPLVLAALLVVFRPGAASNVYHEVAADLAGLMIAALGQAVHVLALAATPIKRGGTKNHLHADRLATDGCYAHCRNPLYVGNLLVIAGLLIMFDNVGALAVAGVFFVCSYVAIVAAEEAYLGRHFGREYRAYCRRVPRWWPRLRGLGATARGLSRSWRQAVSKMYASAYCWIAVALTVLLYKAMLFRGGALTLELVGLLSAYGFFTVLCLLTRHLRKRGYLAAG